MKTGKLFLVGIGPGDKEHMTFRAMQAIEECEVIVGYKTYTKLIKNLLDGKTVISSPMRD